MGLVARTGPHRGVRDRDPCSRPGYPGRATSRWERLESAATSPQQSASTSGCHQDGEEGHRRARRPAAGARLQRTSTGHGSRRDNGHGKTVSSGAAPDVVPGGRTEPAGRGGSVRQERAGDMRDVNGERGAGEGRIRRDGDRAWRRCHGLARRRRGFSQPAETGSWGVWRWGSGLARPDWRSGRSRAGARDSA